MTMVKKPASLQIAIGKGIRHPSVLIIGGRTKIYKDFAQNITEIAKDEGYRDVNLQILDHLPIFYEEDHSMELDLIVMMVDCSNFESFKAVVKSFRHIPLPFFRGRIVMAVHKPKDISDVCVEYERLSWLANDYMCPVLWDFISQENKAIASQIVRKLKICTGALGLPPVAFVGSVTSSDNS